MIKKYLIELWNKIIDFSLCPYTWIGSAGAIYVVALKTTTGYTYINLALFIYCFGIALWLEMNILNVRGKS